MKLSFSTKKALEEHKKTGKMNMFLERREGEEHLK